MRITPRCRPSRSPRRVATTCVSWGSGISPPCSPAG